MAYIHRTRLDPATPRPVFALPYRASGLVAGLGFCLLALSTHAARADGTVPNRSIEVGSSAPREVAQTRISGRVVLAARPYDSNFAVTSVRFLLDGHMLAEVGAPGRFSWDTRGLRAGRHIVQVQAFSQDRFVGISFPTAISIVPPDGADATIASPRAQVQALVELGFHTYEIDPRRHAGIIAPRLAAGGKNTDAESVIEPFSDLSPGGAARPNGLIVEVYLNGVRQDFAPAARLARAEELEPLSTSSGSNASTASRFSALPHASSGGAASGQTADISGSRAASSRVASPAPVAAGHKAATRSSQRVSSRSARRNARRRIARRNAEAARTRAAQASRIAQASRAAMAKRLAANPKSSTNASSTNASSTDASSTDASSRSAIGAFAAGASGSNEVSASGVPRTVWMPARPLLERLGARVHWEAASHTLVADLNMAGGMRRITLCPDAGRPGEGAAFADIDGRHMQLQMPVRQVDNTLMVPLAFCVQALNLRTAWRKENRRLELWTPIAPA